MIYNLPFELDSAPNSQYEAELDIKYNIFNDGIGFYEYHGQKCFDKGKKEVEIENYKIKNIYIDGNKIPFDVIAGKIFDIIDDKFYSRTVQDDVKVKILEKNDI